MNENAGTQANLLRQFPLALQMDKPMQVMATVIAAALAQRWPEAELGILYPAIDQLPEAVLDILAYDFKVDWWDANYSLEEKRRTLKDAWKVHRIKGTKAAVETAISAIYPGTQVQEWWEYGGEPYHFRLFLNAGEIRPDTEKHRKVLERVNYYKSLRSHLDGFIWNFTGEPFVETPGHLVFRRFVTAWAFSHLRGFRFNGGTDFDGGVLFDQGGDGIKFPRFRTAPIRFFHLSGAVRFDGETDFNGGVIFDQAYRAVKLPALRMNGSFSGAEERLRVPLFSGKTAVSHQNGMELPRFSAAAGAFSYGEGLSGRIVMDNWTDFGGNIRFDGTKTFNAYIKEEEI